MKENEKVCKGYAYFAACGDEDRTTKCDGYKCSVDTRWRDVESYASKIAAAAITEDRQCAVDNLFFLLAELMCSEGPVNGFGWDDEFGIICTSENKSGVIADMFDAMYKTKSCTTGSWNLEEDVRNGEVDEYSGHAYVRTW